MVSLDSRVRSCSARWNRRCDWSRRSDRLWWRRNGSSGRKQKKAPHHESSAEPSRCPSWARTRTLLIQSPPAGATFPDNLLGIGHFPSVGARFPAVVCPVLPGETTAVLVRWSHRPPRQSGIPRSLISLDDNELATGRVAMADRRPGAAGCSRADRLRGSPGGRRSPGVSGCAMRLERRRTSRRAPPPFRHQPGSSGDRPPAHP